MDPKKNIVTKLTPDAIKNMIEQDAHQSKDYNCYVQAFNLKEFEGSGESHKQIKLRFQISDGVSMVLALMKKSVFDKMVTIQFLFNFVYI